MSTRSPTIDLYRAFAADAVARAHVPYSNRPEAVVVVRRDGSWIPGVRVESASFSLSIPALLNAATTTVAFGFDDVHAVVGSRPFHPRELTFAEAMHGLSGLTQRAPDLLAEVADLPEPGERVTPFVTRRAADEIRSVAAAARPEAPAIGLGLHEAILLARRTAHRAHVPASEFPVGCLLEIQEEGYIPGVNVEHDDWLHVLCAERNALGTAVSYGFRRTRSLYLACLRHAGCTPCGACRQLLAELAPTSTLWMDGGETHPASSNPVALLPGFFAGPRLLRDT